MTEKVMIEGYEFVGTRISTAKSNILVISSEAGFLGCGFFDMAVADRLGDCAAVVTGVKTFDDMLNAKVVRLSAGAAACGVTIGMSGRDALHAFARQ